MTTPSTAPRKRGSVRVTTATNQDGTATTPASTAICRVAATMALTGAPYIPSRTALIAAGTTTNSSVIDNSFAPAIASGGIGRVRQNARSSVG